MGHASAGFSGGCHPLQRRHGARDQEREPQPSRRRLRLLGQGDDAGADHRADAEERRSANRHGAWPGWEFLRRVASEAAMAICWTRRLATFPLRAHEMWIAVIGQFSKPRCGWPRRTLHSTVSVLRGSGTAIPRTTYASEDVRVGVCAGAARTRACRAGGASSTVITSRTRYSPRSRRIRSPSHRRRDVGNSRIVPVEVMDADGSSEHVWNRLMRSVGKGDGAVCLPGGRASPIA